MDPQIIRWDREVIRDDDGTVFVCCVGEDGQPFALELGPEYAEALGLMLVDPEPEEELT